jgi:hypothetical protein
MNNGGLDAQIVDLDAKNNLMGLDAEGKVAGIPLISGLGMRRLTALPRETDGDAGQRANDRPHR